MGCVLGARCPGRSCSPCPALQLPARREPLSAPRSHQAQRLQGRGVFSVLPGAVCADRTCLHGKG